MCLRVILWVTFGRPVWFAYLKLYTKFEVSNFSGFKDMFEGMPKILAVMRPRPHPLFGKYFVILLTFASIEQCAKY